MRERGGGRAGRRKERREKSVHSESFVLWSHTARTHFNYSKNKILPHDNNNLRRYTHNDKYVFVGGNVKKKKTRYASNYMEYNNYSDIIRPCCRMARVIAADA